MHEYIWSFNSEGNFVVVFFCLVCFEKLQRGASIAENAYPVPTSQEADYDIDPRLSSIARIYA